MADANHLVEAIVSHPCIDAIGLCNCFERNAYNTVCSLLAQTTFGLEAAPNYQIFWPQTLRYKIYT